MHGGSDNPMSVALGLMGTNKRNENKQLNIM